MQFIYTVLGYPLGWIMWLCYKIVPVYAVALILFTLVTRLILLPLSIKQQKSMVRMQLFQPKVAEIQKKYANNKEKMNEEMMKLYQEENYNPMSGCLPMLIQMPILFGLIDVIYKPMTHILRMGSEMLTAATNTAAGILNMGVDVLTRDMTAQLKIIGAVQTNPGAFDPSFVDLVSKLNLSFGPIDLTKTPQFGTFDILWLIPILSGVTSLLLSVFSMKQTQAAGNAQAAGMNKSMMIMMPLMSAYFAFVLPAGVGIYWVISNLLMAAQTYLLNKYMNPAQLAEKAKQEYEEKKEKERQEKIEAKKLAKERGEVDIDQAMSQKEINRLKLAAARQRDAEKYGEEYIEVTDEDLK